MKKHIPVFVGIALISLAVVGRVRAQQDKNPLAGGVWDRYSFRDDKGVESGSPGWYFLTFTTDGHFFILALPHGRGQLSTGIADASPEEVRNHFKGAVARQGSYEIHGSGPYTLVLKDETNLFSPTLQGSCPASSKCQIQIENGEVHLKDAATGHETRWRRLKEGS